MRPPPGELGRAVRRGFAWKLTSLVANQGLRLVTLVVLARELSPHEFGLAAIALAVWGAVSVFTDLALAAALVQRSEIDESDRSTAFWASSMLGLLLVLVGLAASRAVASLFDEPELQWLFAALGLSALLGSLASTQVALLTRALDFRTLELISVSATAVGAGAGIGLAFEGAGAWAIVANALVTALVSCSLVWKVAQWRPQLVFSADSLRKLAGFASLLSATRIVVGLQRTADRLLIGRFLGTPEVGLYTVPANIVFLPAARLVDPIRSVLFPAFSRLQTSPAELADAWLRVTRLVCALLAPVLLLLAVAADEIVDVALPSRWSDAAPVLQILALAGLFQLAGAMNAVVLSALDRLGSVLRVFCLGLALSLVGFAIGQRHGLSGAAAGYALGTVVVTPYYVYVTARVLCLAARAVAGVYLPAIAGLLAMAAAAAAVELILNGSSTVRLVAHTLIGLGVYSLVVLGTSRPIRSDLRAVVARGPGRTLL